MLLPQALLLLPSQNLPLPQVLPARPQQRSQLRSNKKPLILTNVLMSRRLLGFYLKTQVPSTTPAFPSNSLFVVWGRMSMELQFIHAPIQNAVILLTLEIFLAVEVMFDVFI